MSEADSSLAQEWFDLAALDVRTAEILLDEEGPLAVVAFHLQQAIEKYLKGYLIAGGWTLRRTHDLEVLIYEAIEQDDDFGAFLEACQRITEYYIESRYPTGFHSPLDEADLRADLETVRLLVELIHEKLAA